MTMVMVTMMTSVPQDSVANQVSFKFCSSALTSNWFHLLHLGRQRPPLYCEVLVGLDNLEVHKVILVQLSARSILDQQLGGCASFCMEPFPDWSRKQECLGFCLACWVSCLGKRIEDSSQWKYMFFLVWILIAAIMETNSLTETTEFLEKTGWFLDKFLLMSLTAWRLESLSYHQRRNI